MFDHIEYKSFIIGEQPMNHIKFRQRHSFYKFPNILNPNKMPNRINHNPPIRNNRLILHHPNLYTIPPMNHLRQSLQPINIPYITSHINLHKRVLTQYLITFTRDTFIIFNIDLMYFSKKLPIFNTFR